MGDNPHLLTMGDGRLFRIKEFTCKLGFDNILKSEYKTNAPALFRIHEDDENLCEVVYQIFSTYFEDDCAE